MALCTFSLMISDVEINHSCLLTGYYVPVAVLGAVLLLLGNIPGGRLALEEALYHQQHTAKYERQLHVMDPQISS